jgi:hypothetical protein
MAGKVVHDIVEWFGGWSTGNMPSERTEESGRFMVRVALSVDFSIGVIQERENIHGPVPYVLELLKTALHLIRLQIGCKPFEDLDAGALVKEV